MTLLGVDTRLLYVLLVALVATERVVELALSRRNVRRLLRLGGVEAGAGHYPWMVLLHAAFLAACPLEVLLLRRPFVPVLAAAMTFLLATTMALRYWVVASLAGRWSTRVIVLPGARLVRSGPYRWMRHPNYVAVVLELLALPLVHGAWLTAASFSGLNALVLLVRIRVENEALTGSGGSAPSGGSTAPERRAEGPS